MAIDVPPTTTATPPPLEGLGREAGQGWGEGSNTKKPESSTPPLPQREAENRIAHHPPLAPVLLGTALPLWPAAINGYPLVFSDTGTYLSQAIHHYLGWDRPIFYQMVHAPGQRNHPTISSV
jgi:hypothetical protein